MVIKSEDVARAAGVSRATVSQILNGRGQRFSEPTRARVLQAAADLDYRPSIAGRALATGASDIVVVLLPNTDLSGHMQAWLERYTEELAAHGLTLVLQLTTVGRASLEQLVASLRPRAVLALWPFTAEEHVVLKQHAVVAVSPTEFDDGFDHQIGRVQAEYLLAKGHRRLAYVHVDDARFLAWSVPREEGVAMVCTENHLLAPITLRPRLHPDDALAAIDALPDGTGVACFNDDIAIALLHAAKVRGRAVPGDLGIVGMDDTALAATTHPRLATVSVDVSSAATAATRVLLASLGIASEAGGSQRVAPHVVDGQSA